MQRYRRRFRLLRQIGALLVACAFATSLTPVQAKSNSAEFILTGSVGSVMHHNGITTFDVGPGGHLEGHLSSGNATSRVIVTGYTAYGDGRPLFVRPTYAPNIIDPRTCNDNGGIEVNGSCRYSFHTSFCGATLDIGGGVGHMHRGTVDIYFYHYIDFNAITCDWSVG